MVKMPKCGFRAVPSRTARFLYCICSISSGIFSVFPVTVPPFPPQLPLLQKLQEKGLVKIVPYKGTTVTRLNREIVDELIYERTAVEARVLRDFAPHCTPEQRALIRRRADAYAALAQAEAPDYNRLYEADRLLHETWFASMGKMYLFRTLQNAHADYSRFRMLDTITSGGLAEVIADHQNLIDAIERCDLAAFEPLVERHLYGGIRRLGSRLTEEYADYFEPEK